MNSPGLLQRAAGAALGILLFVAAMVFASVMLAVIAVFALVAWAWFWWRRRNLPERRRGVVIEGEYRVEPEPPRRLDDGKP